MFQIYYFVKIITKWNKKYIYILLAQTDFGLFLFVFVGFIFIVFVILVAQDINGAIKKTILWACFSRAVYFYRPILLVFILFLFVIFVIELVFFFVFLIVVFVVLFLLVIFVIFVN